MFICNFNNFRSSRYKHREVCILQSKLARYDFCMFEKLRVANNTVEVTATCRKTMYIECIKMAEGGMDLWNIHSKV